MLNVLSHVGVIYLIYFQLIPDPRSSILDPAYPGNHRSHARHRLVMLGMQSMHGTTQGCASYVCIWSRDCPPSEGREGQIHKAKFSLCHIFVNAYISAVLEVI